MVSGSGGSVRNQARFDSRIPVEGEVPGRGEITEDPMGRVLLVGDGQLQRVDWPAGGSPRLVPHISGLPEPVGNPF
jgi:hypothetical protein